MMSYYLKINLIGGKNIMAEIFSYNTYPSIIKGWTINPENNIIPASTLAELEKDNFFNTQLKLGRYKVSGTSTDKKDINMSSARDNNSKVALEIQNMKPSEAKKVILGNGKDNHGLLDIWVLKKLQKEDMRSGIQSAVEKQIKMLYDRSESDKE